MGGIGSGRPAGSGSRRKTTDLRALDVRQLARAGCLRPGQGYLWTWSCEGVQTASVYVVTGSDHLQLSYRLRIDGSEWHPVIATVRLERTPCTYGGTRPWLLCPHCLRRCAVIYTGRRPLCRRCLRLAYPSQSETALDRCHRRSQKMFQRIGVEDPCQPMVRPKGMHRKTFERLRAAAWQERMRWEDYVEAVLDTMESRLCAIDARLAASAITKRP